MGEGKEEDHAHEVSETRLFNSAYFNSDPSSPRINIACIFPGMRQSPSSKLPGKLTLQWVQTQCSSPILGSMSQPFCVLALN